MGVAWKQTSPTWKYPHPNHKNKSADGDKPGILHPSESPSLPLAPSAGGFTNGAKVNPGRLKAVDKQHRVPVRGLHPSNTRAVSKALSHTRASRFSLTPGLWGRPQITSSHLSDQEAEAQRGSALEQRAGGEAQARTQITQATLTPSLLCSLES